MKNKRRETGPYSDTVSSVIALLKPMIFFYSKEN